MYLIACFTADILQALNTIIACANPDRVIVGSIFWPVFDASYDSLPPHKHEPVLLVELGSFELKLMIPICVVETFAYVGLNDHLTVNVRQMNDALEEVMLVCSVHMVWVYRHSYSVKCSHVYLLCILCVHLHNLLLFLTVSEELTDCSGCLWRTSNSLQFRVLLQVN